MFCVWVMEFKHYCFGKSYDTNLYENELLKLYNSTLTKCTHLTVKLHLARGYHVYRNSTWQNAKPGRKLKVERETNKSSKSSDLYTCAIKINHQFFDTWLTMGHIPREISRHCCFIYGRRWLYYWILNLHNLQSISDSCWWFRGAVAANIFR